MKKFILYFIVVLAFYPCAHAQELRGLVLDKSSSEAVSYASIKINGRNIAMADSNGHFKAGLAVGSNTIAISKVGFVNYFQTIKVEDDDKISLTFFIDKYINELQSVVISSSKHEKEIAREAVSITLIQPSLIANTNSNTLSDVLNRVPGVSIVDGQAIMRGGVGWSYNIGSRVMVLLDDMPLMGPDVGDVQWDLLPIEAAENIEVMKGPASVLYGSSASNGTVSVRTGWGTNKPETKVQWYQGITSYPKDNYKAWWEKSAQPFNTGAFFSHKQKFGRFDLVMSGNVDAVRSYIQDNDNYRARMYFKTRYRFKSIPGLSVGLNGNVMLKKAGRFFLWADADSNNLKPYGGSAAVDYYRVWSIDPHLTYVKPNNFTLNIKLRHYQITRFADRSDTLSLHRLNDAIANMQAVDINFQKTWTKNFNTTTGIYLTRMWAVGNLYPGNQSGYSAAAFMQGEYLFNKRLTLTAGLRYEVNALGSIQASPGPLKRGGINYKAASKTYLRATYGEGFRFPSVTERYIDDHINGISIIPNPSLKSEFGWYTEVGIKQGFKIGQFNATFDAAFFWQEYQNLIQFQFRQWTNDSFYIDNSSGTPTIIPVHGIIGFKAVNVGLSRTAGMEYSLEGNGSIGQFGIRTLCGYTYVYPVDLTAAPEQKAVGKYLQNFASSYGGLNSAQQSSLLTYRNRKLVKGDVEVTYKKVSLGYGVFYYSVFEKVDEAMLGVVPGLQNFLAKSKNGDWVQNLRCSYQISPNVTFALLVNNLTNHEYAIRLAKIEPPRNFNLQVRLRF